MHQNCWQLFNPSTGRILRTVLFCGHLTIPFASVALGKQQKLWISKNWTFKAWDVLINIPGCYLFLVPNKDVMPGGISLRHQYLCSGCTVCLLFMSFSFTATDFCKSNQQQTEQIGCDVRMRSSLAYTSTLWQIYPSVRACFYHVRLCMFRPISSSSMPTQKLPVPYLDRVFLSTHALGLYCVYPVLQRVKPLASAAMAAGCKNRREPSGLWACQIGRMY